MPALRALCAVVALSLTMTASAEKPPEEWDGLQKTKVKGIQLAYVRPGVDISKYGKVMLDPIDVSFQKNWTPKRAGSGTEISPSDLEAIKQRIGTLAEKTFSDTISKNDGYPVVEQAGPDVMRVTAELTDIYVSAPASDDPGLHSTYTKSTGRITLVAELRDSETGALFARVVDKVQDNDNKWRFTNSVENSQGEQRAVREWAEILRKRLDAVHEAAGTKTP